ncbi:MAG TPA: hypothetical protein VE760_04445 [Acidimicrobiales bacterium]|nr:hypothetical protein [Acidimicrobiales bacterium]
MQAKRRALLVMAIGAAALMAPLFPSPAFALGQETGRGATIEEFVCFRSTSDEIRLGTGKVITTPSGSVHVVCTGEPL